MEIYYQFNLVLIKEYFIIVICKMFEEMMGEFFEYVEELDVFRGYEVDIKDLDVRFIIRVLVDLVMVLFNMNEFFYVF